MLRFSLGPNRYMRAIAATANVIQHYDFSKTFKVYGIGAIPMGSTKQAHDLCLTCSSGKTECEGIAGVLSAYQMALQTCTLGNLCRLAPLIKNITAHTEEATQTYQRYNVLMVLTAVI